MTLFRITSAFAVAVVAVLPASASAASPVPPSSTSAAAKTAERIIAKAVARADRQRACKSGTAVWTAEPLGAAPDPKVLAQFAPLRRPAQEGDALPFAPMAGFKVYPGASRRVTAADGTVGYITVGRLPFPGPASACLLRQQAEISRAARTTRHAVRVLLDRKARELRLLAAQKRTDDALLFTAAGAFSSNVDVVGLQQGPAIAVGLFSGAESRVFGLVTDGVASVTFRDADGGPVTTPVQDNVVALTAAFTEAAHPRFELRDASGAVVRQMS